MINTKFSIMVFAHNNEETIQSCLESIIKAGASKTEEIHVIINGSSDGTQNIVYSMSNNHPNIKPTVLKLGDRANAWNYYIYNISNDDCHHIFIDGDITISPDSILVLKEAIINNPAPLAYSTLPKNGRLRKYWTKKIIEKHMMFGNYYCLPLKTIEHIKKIKFFLPNGFLCDDAFITWAILRDFQPRTYENGNLILPIKEIGFSYISFSLFKPSGLKSHIKRHFVYSKRNIQTKLLTDRIMKNGFKSIPTHISKLYSCKKIIMCIFHEFSFYIIFYPFAALALCKSKNSSISNTDTT